MDSSSAIMRGGEALRRLAGRLSSAFEAWRRRQREMSLRRELEGLDEHILKDIGYRREELTHVLRQETARCRAHALPRPIGKCPRCPSCGELTRCCAG